MPHARAISNLWSLKCSYLHFRSIRRIRCRSRTSQSGLLFSYWNLYLANVCCNRGISSCIIEVWDQSTFDLHSRGRRYSIYHKILEDKHVYWVYRRDGISRAMLEERFPCINVIQVSYANTNASQDSFRFASLSLSLSLAFLALPLSMKFSRGNFFHLAYIVGPSSSPSRMLLPDKRCLTSSSRLCVANRVATARSYCRRKSSRSIVSRATIDNQVARARVRVKRCLKIGCHL